MAMHPVTTCYKGIVLLYSDGSTTGMGIGAGSAVRICLCCKSVERGVVILAIPILATVLCLPALRIASAGNGFQHSQGEVCSYCAVVRQTSFELGLVIVVILALATIVYWLSSIYRSHRY